MIPRPSMNFEPPPITELPPSLASEQLRMLSEENARLRKAGAELSIAAMRVATEYDGVHRLMLAVSVWAKAMADEHGRGAKDEVKPDGRD